MNHTTIGNNTTFITFLYSDERQLHQIYKENRASFFDFATNHFECQNAEIGNIFRQAFTILYLNIKHENITHFHENVTAYLFSIGYTLLKQHYKKTTSFKEMTILNISSIDYKVIEKQTSRRQKLSLTNLLRNLGEPCRTILKLHYFCRFSIKKIAQQIGYKNEAVAHKKKNQCFQELKNTIEQQKNLTNTLLNH